MRDEASEPVLRCKLQLLILFLETQPTAVHLLVLKLLTSA